MSCVCVCFMSLLSNKIRVAISREGSMWLASWTTPTWKMYSAVTRIPSVFQLFTVSSDRQIISALCFMTNLLPVSACTCFIMEKGEVGVLSGKYQATYVVSCASSWQIWLILITKDGRHLSPMIKTYCKKKAVCRLFLSLSLSWSSRRQK